MSILDKIPSLAENELFQKLAAIEDITALCKEDQEKYDDAIKVMRDHIAPIDKIARYTGLAKEDILKLN